MDRIERRHWLTLVVGSALPWGAVPVRAAVPDAATTPARLHLNGQGVRRVEGRPLYRLALYLPRPARSLDEVLELPGAKRLHLVALRAIEADRLAWLIAERIGLNATPQELLRLPQTLFELGRQMGGARKLNAGDAASLEWLPEAGLLTRVNGRPLGHPLPEPALFSALLRLWLGRYPVDVELKSRLLGAPIHSP